MFASQTDTIVSLYHQRTDTMIFKCHQATEQSLRWCPVLWQGSSPRREQGRGTRVRGTRVRGQGNRAVGWLVFKVLSSRSTEYRLFQGQLAAYCPTSANKTHCYQV